MFEFKFKERICKKVHEPQKYKFPFKKFGETSRQFNPTWFTEYAN